MAKKTPRRTPHILAGLDSLVYTRGQMAVLLHRSPRTISRMLANGTLPSVTIGGTRLVLKTQLEAWLAEKIEADEAARDGE